MLLFNIIFAILAIYFGYRGAKLFLESRKAGHGFIKEGVIGLILILMYGLIVARSLLLIEVGPDKIYEPGGVLAHYINLGAVILQMLISDFIIKFGYDSITKRKTET